MKQNNEAMKGRLLFRVKSGNGLVLPHAIIPHIHMMSHLNAIVLSYL